MKAYLFIETGEVRSSKKGEYVKHGDTFWKAVSDDIFTPGPIVTRHEIEIPDRATHIRLIPEKDEGIVMSVLLPHPIIPLPHPKRKVKKWKWVIGGRTNYVFLTTDYYAEDDPLFPECIWRRAVLETEIEVEE